MSDPAAHLPDQEREMTTAGDTHEHEYRSVWGQHDLRCTCGANRPMKCVGVVLDSGGHLSCSSLAEPNEMQCKTCEEWND